MKIAILFSRHSEALFNTKSKRTFGGDSVQLYNIAKELSNYKDIKTYSLIPNYEQINFPDEDYFNLVKTFTESDLFVIKILKLHKVLNSLNPKIVIQHGLSPLSCLLAFYCKLRNIRFIFMFAHDIEVSGKYQSSQKKCWLFRILLSSSYRLVVQNIYQKNVINKKFKKQAIILKNGFHLHNATNLKKTKIIWVARSDKWKNPGLFIYIAEKFPKEKFIMICPHSFNISNYEYSMIKTKAKRVKNLIFIDFVKFQEINNYFKKAKLLINTSDQEGYPQTFIQAAVNSVPIISLNSNPDNFLEKYNCGFCAYGDMKRMEEKITYLLNNKLLLKTLSTNSYNYARRNHNISNTLAELIKEIR